MEEPHRLDLTYITERIITILCPSGCPEGIYLQNLQEIISMLQSKHGHNYMLINLSQKHGSLTRMNHKVLDTGWVDLLAPSLDQIFSVCTVMENWLQTHSKHVLVLHCRVNTADLDMHIDSTLFLKVISVIADVSLDHFATRRFYNDKLSALMTPSQKRSALWSTVLKSKPQCSCHINLRSFCTFFTFQSLYIVESTSLILYLKCKPAKKRKVKN
uniref:Phosphatase tensin-type domain-containing protein n=1 Tax=Amphiprion percula TaxID=161767 RepID=A0A3P8TG74_AMPPE